jgi:hypothetical protein
LDLLDELSDCEHFDVRFVRARYGGGKTHFLRCLQAEAKLRKWATAYVLLKHGEVELDRFDSIVAEIADKLELPDGQRGLPSLLRQALTGIARRSGYDPTGPVSFKTRERAQAAAAKFVQEHGLGYHFNLALQTCMFAVIERDEMLFAQFAHWLACGGQPLTVDPNSLSASPVQPKTRASRTVLKPLGLGDAEQLIRLLALLVDEAGFSGLYLAIDEWNWSRARPRAAVTAVSRRCALWSIRTTNTSCRRPPASISPRLPTCSRVLTSSRATRRCRTESKTSPPCRESGRSTTALPS